MRRPPGRPARIELVVDEVVWHGGNPGERHAFGEALQRALVHELGNPIVQRALARSGELKTLDAGRIPRVSGDTVARALAGGIVNATRTKP